MNSMKVNSNEVQWPGAILFDLDGTLVDSVPDIASAVNLLLGRDGLAPLTEDEVRSMIGNGIKKLVQRAYAARGTDLAGDELERTTDRMMGIYGDWLVVRTALMKGAAEVISVCAAAGVKIAVVTNKPEAFAAEIVTRLGLGDAVAVILGGDSGPKRKPAPDMLVETLARLGADAGDAVMVGDSPADIDAARAVPMASIAVRGGYTNVAPDDLGADLVIDSLEDLPAAIMRLREAA